MVRSTSRSAAPTRARRSPALLLGFLLAACSSSTEPAFTRWEAVVEPVLPSTVGGVAAAVTQFGRTEASVLIEEAETEISYGWRLDTGSCQGSGTILGGAALYPPLIPNQGGTASANAVLPVLLRARSTYSVRILQSGGGGQLVVACGDLVLKE